MRNPIDFTPKAVYEQIDADAAYHRRFRFAWKVAAVIAVFIWMAALVYVLKNA